MRKHNFKLPSRIKRHKEKRIKSAKNKRIFVFGFTFFLISALTFFIFLIFKIQTLKKFAYVNNNDNNVEVVVIDSLKDKYIKILIGKDFRVESSRNYGQYKIGNLWILGMKDGFRGKLVAETVTKNFAMPIYLWKDGRYSNLNLLQIIKSLIVQKQLFGYDYTLKTTNTPDSVLINFASDDSLLLSETETVSAKLEIVDLTGSNNLAEIIVNILGVYGVKTTSYSKGYDKDLDCEVGGINKDLVEVVSKIFSCQKELDDGGVDLKIRIGKAFADRF
jgi:hypothetical protein